MANLADDPAALQKLQFDYAWKWFSFHADQRIKMFYYMLVVFGIFAAGIVNALDKHLPHKVIAGLCFIASTLAVVFALLDRRNRDLVWLGEDVLMHLERESLFGNLEINGRYQKRVKFGILWRQALEERQATERIRTAMHEKSCAPLVVALRDVWRGKHRVWLPVLSCLVAVLFFSAGVFIWNWGPLLISSKH